MGRSATSQRSAYRRAMKEETCAPMPSFSLEGLKEHEYTFPRIDVALVYLLWKLRGLTPNRRLRIRAGRRLRDPLRDRGRSEDFLQLPQHLSALSLEHRLEAARVRLEAGLQILARCRVRVGIVLPAS